MLQLQEARDRLQTLAGDEVRVQGGSLVCRGGRFGFGTDLFEPGNDFTFKLCELMKVPHSLYQRCSPELQSHMLAEFASGEGRYSVIVRHGKADSIGRARDIFIPIVTIFDTLASSLGGNVQFDTVGLDKGVYTIEAVTDIAKAEPRKGDLLHGGVLVQVGQFNGLNYRMMVGSYIHRLVCSNGMYRMESENVQTIKRLGSEGDALRFFATLVSQTYAAVTSRFMPEFAETVNHQVPDPSALIRIIAKETSVPSDVLDGLLSLVSSLPANPAVYDVVNMVTQYAQVHTLARRRLLLAGGRMVDNSVQRCSQCHRVIESVEISL